MKTTEKFVYLIEDERTSEPLYFLTDYDVRDDLYHRIEEEGNGVMSVDPFSSNMRSLVSYYDGRNQHLLYNQFGAYLGEALPYEVYDWIRFRKLKEPDVRAPSYPKSFQDPVQWEFLWQKEHQHYETRDGRPTLIDTTTTVTYFFARYRKSGTAFRNSIEFCAVRFDPSIKDSFGALVVLDCIDIHSYGPDMTGKMFFGDWASDSSQYTRDNPDIPYVTLATIFDCINDEGIIGYSSSLAEALLVMDSAYFPEVHVRKGSFKGKLEETHLVKAPTRKILEERLHKMTEIFPDFEKLLSDADREILYGIRRIISQLPDTAPPNEIDNHLLKFEHSFSL